MKFAQKITPCLWFDDQAEPAAEFYLSIFKPARIVQITRYTESGHEYHGKHTGTVMTVAFELAGQAFVALNGGPAFTIDEAVSFQVHCESQQELDFYWEKLAAGGDPSAQQCGWLKDRFGVSWQIVPEQLLDWLSDSDIEKAGRCMQAVLGMKKLNIAELQQAYRGRK